LSVRARFCAQCGTQKKSKNQTKKKGEREREIGHTAKSPKSPKRNTRARRRTSHFLRAQTKTRTHTQKKGTMMTMTRTATATATTATNAFNSAHKKRFSSSSLSPNKVQNNRRCLRHPKHAATVVVAGRFPDERTYIMIK
jgi:hypothetical protein